MVLPRKVRQQIEKHDLEAVETDWLERSEATPLDIGYFGSVSRALVGAGQTETAKILLDLLDEQLVESASWQERIDLLRGTGPIHYPAPRLHATILETLRSVHSGVSALEELIETVGLERGVNEIDKTWDKVGRLESLIRFDTGTVVYMEGKGVGRVVEVNHKLESFKIDVEGKGEMRVGFRAAGKLLKALPAEHILARKVTNPESLAELGPSDLLAETLQGFGRPMTAAEVRDVLHGLVTTAKWNSWWTSARKHPQIVASADVRNAYQWVESSEDARGAIWKTFDAANPRTKLDLLRRSSAHDSKLRDRMARQLERLARESMKTDPGLCFEIWYAIEKSGASPEKDDWSPQILLESLADPVRLLPGLDGRASRARAYDLFEELRDDATDLYSRALISENDPKLLERLVAILQVEAPDGYRRSVERCLAQPGRAGGFFTWLAEEAAEDEELMQRLGTRLFRKILAAIGDDDLSSYRARLLKLCDSGGTLPRMLPHFTLDGAREAEQALVRAAGIGPDLRKRLINAIQLKFPELHQSDDEPLYALEASIHAKRAELKRILEEDIPTNRKAIQTAREMGDLRENFEYKAARQRHELLTALATELNEELQRARPLRPETIDSSQVRIGTQVRLAGGTEGERTLRILGPWESSPEDGIVSYESDLGKSLLGKREGDEVKINEQKLQISSISTIDI